MARIIGVNSNKKGLIRSVLLYMGGLNSRSGNESSKRELEQSID